MNSKIIKVGIIAILIMSMAACTNSTKPTTQVTIEQIQQDAVVLDLIKAKFEKVVSIKVNTQAVQGTQALVIADLTYDNGEAIVSGEIIINYEWDKKTWKAVNTQFTYKAVGVKNETDEKEVLKEFKVDPELNKQFEIGINTVEPVILSKSLNLERGEANYVLERNETVNLWTSKLTSTVKAKYDYQEGWKYTVESWSYKETTKWEGTWVIQWGDYGKETQYAVNEKMTLIISGEMTFTKNSDGVEDEDRSVNVQFKRAGSPYNLPATLSKLNESKGLYNTRFITFKYGNQANDVMFLELRFNANQNNVTTEIVAVSYDGNIGSATKIK